MIIPKVSVVITTFNRPQLLKEAIESVLGQSFKDLELIIIDDFSPGPETENTVRQFFDTRIRYIKNPSNLGSTAGLNIGLGSARGEFVAILDDDDAWISKEKLSEQVKFLENNPDHVLVGTGLETVSYSNGREISRMSQPLKDEEIRRIILGRNPFCHSSVLYRRNAALKCGLYDKTLTRGKDYDLLLKLGLAGKMAVLPLLAVKYREAFPGDRDVVGIRYRDAMATAAVVLRNRKNYPGFSRAYAILLARRVIFKILTLAPWLYGLYKRS